MSSEPAIEDPISPPALHDQSRACAGADADSGDASGEEGAPDPEIRRRLIRQFEQWLDRISGGEPPPPGLPAEIINEAQQSLARSEDSSADLLSLAAALTALNGEVRLQGRAFRQLAEALAPMTEVSTQIARIETAQELIAREIAERFAHLDQADTEDEQDADDEASDPAFESSMPQAVEMLAVLFDLHERASRGLRTFDAAESRAVQISRKPRGFLSRLFSRGRSSEELAAAALAEGYRLMLSRLAAALHQWEIERIGSPGEQFDPELMAVVDVENTNEKPDGSVVEVYRSGYRLHDRVLATARVKVAKALPKAHAANLTPPSAKSLENGNG